MFDTLTEPVIRARWRDELATTWTLPGVMAELARGEIASFPVLRPHQRHVWHAFLVQLATLALLKGGRSELPEGEDDWRELIRGLTPEWPDDEPWSLVVEDVSRPALLQPPVPREEFADFKPIETPDALDMLVTSKNHDLKSEVASGGQADDWLFALISLQTQEGYMGSGKYGISRMNSGTGSRTGFGVAIASDLGARFRRDVARLLVAVGEDGTFPEWQRRDKGISLLWMEPWAKEDAALAPDRMERLYIDICRRVRLVCDSGRLAALDGGSKAPRVAAKDLRGVTGDPWMPIDQGEVKALSINSDGFSYSKMVDLIDSSKYALPILGTIHGNDPQEGLLLTARAIARGDGKTSGYHERSIRIARKVIPLFTRREGRDELARKAQGRVQALGELSGALRFALRSLAQGGPDKVTDKPITNGFIKPWLRRFEAEVDRDFFPELWRELEQDTAEARAQAYFEWRRQRRDHAETLLDKAAGSLPLPVARRYRAQVKAKSAFHGSLRKSGAFKETYDTPPEEAA